MFAMVGVADIGMVGGDDGPGVDGAEVDGAVDPGAE